MTKTRHGELHKIKWSGNTIIGNSQLLHILLIRCNANYHVTTWCVMQTGKWISYSDSTHFSDKFSYKILFILSYGSKDINFAIFNHFQKNRGRAGTFLTEVQISPVHWPAGLESDGAEGAQLTTVCGWRAGPLVKEIMIKKLWLFAWSRIRNLNLQRWGHGTNQLS
jgi:hypothetical protein